MTIHAFDFDGTLTRRDTLIEFIRYVKGNKEFLIGFLKHLHLLILMKIGIMPNWKTKRIIFQYFFGGMTLEKFNEYCEKFAKEKASLLRKKGMAAVNKAMMDGDQVVIISASIENWVEPFFTHPQPLPKGGESDSPTPNTQLPPPIKIIGTRRNILTVGNISWWHTATVGETLLCSTLPTKGITGSFKDPPQPSLKEGANGD